MKTNNDSDPLDQKIDALLASRPLKASDDFAARVLAASESTQQSSTTKQRRLMAKVIAFALPLAAAFVVAISLPQVDTQPQPAEDSVASINPVNADEIFLLEESLSSLASLDTNDFAADDLLSTLDALSLEI